jgi:hypothetical protein
MKKPSRKSKKLFALRRKAGYVVGASLLAAGVSAPAADAVKPEQMYEGGTNAYANWIELSVGGMMSDGNTAQAQQRTRLNSGAFGGIEDLHYQTETTNKTTLEVDGRYLPENHDYKFGLGVEKEDLGFIRFSFESFRTYYSGNGGYSPVGGVAFPNSGDALALDRGKISLEAGYNKKGQPKVTFKYTHSYRKGEEGTTIWGLPPVPTASTLRLNPGIMDIDEKSDAFQLDVTDRIKKTDVGLGFRFETGELNDAHLLTSFQSQKITDQQGTSYDMESVHAFTETWIKPNLFLSTGFMFANLDDTFSGSRIYGDDFDVVYSPGYPANYYGYYNLNGGAHQHEYVFNVNLMSLPTKNFSITPSLRVQKEDISAQSTETGTWYDSSGESQVFANNSGYDSLDVRERLEARYTGVTNWVFTATGDLTEGQGSLNEQGGITQLIGAPDGQLPVLFRTDDSRFFQKYALSARWYPVKQASVDVGGYYKDNQYDYANTQDSTPNNAGAYYSLYPGFLVYQGFQTWDGNTRLTLHPLSNITLVSRYEYQVSTIATRPDAASGLGEVDASQMHSHIFGQNVSWTPLNWLCLQAGANYVISETKTPASDYTQAILNSQNNYWTVNFNAGFVLDDKTDLNVGYFYYRAADGQNAVVNGLPLGTDAEEHSINATLTRRLTKNLRLNLKYAFTHYEDFASAGNYNFNAHVIFSSLQYRF